MESKKTNDPTIMLDDIKNDINSEENETIEETFVEELPNLDENNKAVEVEEEQPVQNPVDETEIKEEPVKEQVEEVILENEAAPLTEKVKEEQLEETPEITEKVNEPFVDKIKDISLESNDKTIEEEKNDSISNIVSQKIDQVYDHSIESTSTNETGKIDFSSFLNQSEQLDYQKDIKKQKIDSNEEEQKEILKEAHELDKQEKPQNKEEGSKKQKCTEDKEPKKKISKRRIITFLVLLYLDIIIVLGIYQIMQSRNSDLLFSVIILVVIVNIIGLKISSNKVRPVKEKKEPLNVNVMHGVKNFDKDKENLSFRDYYNLDYKVKSSDLFANKNEFNEETITADNENHVDNLENKGEEVVDLYTNEKEVVINETRTITTNILDKDISFEDLAEDFKHFLNENGVDINTNTLCNFFASLAASKLIFIQTKDIFMATKILKLFTIYVGTNFYSQKVEKEWDSTFNLRYSFDGTKYFENDFFKAFESAIDNRNQINIVLLKGVDMETMPKYFNDYLQYVNDPGLDIQINLQHPEAAKSENFIIPKNLWIFAFPQVIEEVELTKKFVSGSVVLNLNGKEIDPVATSVNEQECISYQHFLELIIDDNQDKFVPEDVWKKIDAFEEGLARTSKFKISNKLFIKMERFITAYYLCGGELEDGLDSMINYVILPVINHTTFKYDETTEDESILSLADSIFGLENITLSKETLEKINTKIKMK